MDGVYRTQEEQLVYELKNSLNERLSGFVCEAMTKLIEINTEPERAREIINGVIVGALKEKRNSTLVFVEPQFEYDPAQDPRD